MLLIEENLRDEIANKKTILNSKPRNLMVVLSNKCNIACIMCLTSRSKWELPKERLDEIILMFPYLERIMWNIIFAGNGVYCEPAKYIYTLLSSIHAGLYFCKVQAI